MIEEYDGSKKQYEKVADDGGFVELNGGSIITSTLSKQWQNTSGVKFYEITTSEKQLG